MGMSRRDRKTLWITLAVLLPAGMCLGLYLHRDGGASTMVVLADVLFSMAELTLLWGIVRLLGNMRMFTSTTYAFHRFHDLVRSKQMKSSVMKDDYLKYRESRAVHP